MVITIFDLWLAIALAAPIILFILITDTIFSVIVTFIFLKPILDLLQTARGIVRTTATRRLERTKRWNFAGLILTVVSSTALYLHGLAYFVLSVFHQHSLTNSSMFGNPFAFGFHMVSMLNILGMILLCGMFKDTVLPSRFVHWSNIMVGPSDLVERRQELGIAIDSHAYSQQVAMPE
jgi:hypothetical protein